jgi:3-oxoacyl-[acyl-carrier protein] reductase
MDKRPILITGASSEIGRALMARLLARADASLIVAHCFQGCQSLAEAAANSAGRVLPLAADLRDPGAVMQTANQIVAEYGVPGRIVHLPANRLKFERFAQLDTNRLEEDFAIQVLSIAELLRVFLPHLRRPAGVTSATQPNAKIVFVLSSVTAGVPPKYMTGYIMVKYALLGMMRALAAEYGSAGCNFNGVSPSMVDTQFLRDVPAKAVEMAAASHPLGRNATPADVVPLIEYLLSPESDYLSGVNIPVAGGQAM